jgi:large subunit ribosomal protein L9
MMKVILLSEVRGRGGEGDVIDVARGFANNYLLPQHIAIPATPGNLKQLEMRRKNIAKREEVRIANAEALKAQLDSAKVKVDAKVGAEGVLFGSVTAQMITDAVKAQLDVEIDRKSVDLRVAIKTAGMHEVTIALYREIKASLTVYVGAEGEPIPSDEPVVEEVAEEEQAEEAAPEAAEEEAAE